MAKHSFPYKPICFKCKATFARARASEEERTEEQEVRGGKKEGREGGEKRRKPACVEAANWYERKLV